VPLSEVRAARQLAHEQDVHAFEQVGAQRGVPGQRGIDLHRAQVGEQVEVLAQLEQALLRADRRGGVGPLRPADRAEQHGVGALAGGQRVVGERVPYGVDGAAAHHAFVVGEGVPVALGDAVEHAPRLRDDLRADPVAGESHDRCLHGVYS